MATLTLLCGLPGSGKTTYARRLEAAGAIRFGADDWLVPLFGHHMPRELFDARRKVMRDLQWDLAAKLLSAGVDVVLDDGFWRMQERDEYRARAADLGAAANLLYFPVPDAELWRRLDQRNQNLPPGTFEIDRVALAQFNALFEEPLPAEQAIAILPTPLLDQ